jgi:hypothetical protein
MKKARNLSATGFDEALVIQLISVAKYLTALLSGTALLL